jgi:16S rRNA (uracil1498-N3)-methyltransferase
VHRFYDPDLSETATRLPPAEAQHAKVLRIRAGEEFEVTDGRGLAVIAQFDSDGEDYVRLGQRSEPVGYRIHLVQALAKNDRDELAIQAATELGASEFTPWQAARSVVQWSSDKVERNRERWQQIALGAMKQSGRSWAPKVNSLASTGQLPAGGLLLAAGAPPLTSDLLPEGGVVLVVGPEGGVTEAETHQLLERGYRQVSINEAVLRTSTAGPAAIAIISALKYSASN